MKVTLELRDARKERPERSCDVFVIIIFHGSCTNIAGIHYSKNYERFNCNDLLGSISAFDEDENDYYLWAYKEKLEEQLKNQKEKAPTEAGTKSNPQFDYKPTGEARQGEGDQIG